MGARNTYFKQFLQMILMHCRVCEPPKEAHGYWQLAGIWSDSTSIRAPGTKPRARLFSLCLSSAENCPQECSVLCVPYGPGGWPHFLTCWPCLAEEPYLLATLVNKFTSFNNGYECLIITLYTSNILQFCQLYLKKPTELGKMFDPPALPTLAILPEEAFREFPVFASTCPRTQPCPLSRENPLGLGPGVCFHFGSNCASPGRSSSLFIICSRGLC